MQNQVLLILLGLLLTGFSSFAQQDKTPSFRIQIAYDTIGLEEQFEVKYTLENAKAVGQFQTPAFHGFQILSGPMTGTSVSIINGDMTQSTSYTYIIKPTSLGIFNLDAVHIETEQGVLVTDDVTVVIVQQVERPKYNNPYDPFSRNPFFNQTWDGQQHMEDMMRGFDQLFKFEPPTYYDPQNPNNTNPNPTKKEEKVYKKV